MRVSCLLHTEATVRRISVAMHGFLGHTLFDDANALEQLNAARARAAAPYTRSSLNHLHHYPFTHHKNKCVNFIPLVPFLFGRVITLEELVSILTHWKSLPEG